MSYEAMECVQLPVKCIKAIRIHYQYDDFSNNIFLATDGSAVINGMNKEDLDVVGIAISISLVIILLAQHLKISNNGVEQI